MTIKEIASLAGVSISTVSKIVNNKDHNINPETRSRVLKLVKEYNYTPYGMVKDISNAKTFLIGVLLRDASKNGQMLNGILQAAQENGYQILLLDSCNHKEMELKHITALCKNKVDGVLWEPVDQDSAGNVHYFQEQNIFVCYISGQGALPSYEIDFASMGYAMTKKLIDYKHTKITCILKENSRRSAEILKGFKKCLYDHNIPFQEKALLYLSERDLHSKILNHKITGVVSSHFTLSLVLYEQMSKLHYRIPSALSLVSLKDDIREDVSFPHISSISIPYRDFGGHICQALIRQCEKDKTETEMGEFLFTPNCVFDKEDSLDIPSFFKAKKLIVVGSINMDITFNVDWLPQPGKTTTIINSTVSVGGKGANQSVGAAKLRREVSLIGELGNDTDSAMIFDVLEKEGVATQGVHRDMNSQTGKAYIYIEGNGESTITILPGANGKMSPRGLQKCQHLFENGGFCLISTEIPMDAALEAARIAKSCGVKVILKPAALKAIPEELLHLTDIFVPNRKEAAVLCPHLDSVEKQAAYFLGKGIETVIITLGHEGCFLKNQEFEKYFPAAEFVTIDSTGGADAFISALASYLIEGYSMERSIRIANYAAGFCVSRQGVVPALVDSNTLETHISKREPELLKFKK